MFISLSKQNPRLEWTHIHTLLYEHVPMVWTKHNCFIEAYSDGLYTKEDLFYKHMYMICIKHRCLYGCICIWKRSQNSDVWKEIQQKWIRLSTNSTLHPTFHNKTSTNSEEFWLIYVVLGSPSFQQRTFFCSFSWWV